MSPRPPIVLLVTLVACGGRPVSDTSENESSESVVADDTEAESEAPTTEGPEGGTTDMGPCESDGDCPPGMLCLQVECQLDCGQARVTIEHIPTPTLWVIDRSASMTELFDHDADPATPTRSRWDQAYELVSTVSQSLGEGHNQGLLLFPAASACDGAAGACFDESACEASASLDLPFPADPDEGLMALSEALETQHVLGARSGGSPLTAALTTARSAAQEELAEVGVSPVLVLVTDGAINCASDACTSQGDCPALEQLDFSPVDEVIALANELDVRTLVVGVDAYEEVSAYQPGDHPSGSRLQLLESLALAGLFPQMGEYAYHHADEPGPLIEALTGGGALIANCELDLTSAPNFPPSADQLDLVDVYVGPDEEFVPHHDDLSLQQCQEDLADGWMWATPGITLALCGSACDAFQDTGRFRAIYGCPDGG